MTSDQTYPPSPADIRAATLALMEERQIPGVQIAVVRDRQIVMHDTFGLANVEHGVPVTAESVFSINSMTKAFTGIALMQLVESGVIDLHAPISQYLDDLPEAWKPVTIVELASHTSGLPEMMRYNPDMTVGLVGDGSEESAWSIVYDAPLEFAPSQGYSYNQTNYALLGRIIDKATAQPFRGFISQRQFAAAGMTHTVFADDSQLIPHRADSYMRINPEGDPLPVLRRSHFDWPDVLKTGVGLHSTAEDLSRWIIALQTGQLLTDPTSFDIMSTPVRLHTGQPGVWGVGWIASDEADGRVCTPAGGGKAQISLYPDGLAVVVLTNVVGAFPEHLATVEARRIDLPFFDAIAEHYRTHG